MFSTLRVVFLSLAIRFVSFPLIVALVNYAIPQVLGEEFTASASSQALLTSINMAADASWEFERDLEGWASSTTEEMSAAVYQKDGEMRIQIHGALPHFDSPKMLLTVADQENIVIKYRYIGQSTQGMVQIFGIQRAIHSTDALANKNTDFTSSLYFYVIGDGNWHIAYIPLDSLSSASQAVPYSIVETIRLWPATFRPADGIRKESPAPNAGNSFTIDWIRIIRNPILKRVTGCYGEMYSDEITFANKIALVSQSTEKINGFLNTYHTIWERRNTTLSFARSYNCRREGGEVITLEGLNFGASSDISAPAVVEIDGVECTNVVHDRSTPQEMLTCVTPKMPMSSNPQSRFSTIKIRNGRLPGLFYGAPLFKYAVAPPIPSDLFISNTAARSIDLNWKIGGSFWQHVTVTGFKIRWRRQQSHASWEFSMIIGNITTTSIRYLEPNTSYLIGISALCEDQTKKIPLDLYGRRDRVIEGALHGEVASISAKTLAVDLRFPFFNANLTQNHSSIEKSATLGPTGNFGGEGHFGLNLVAHASIENCNSLSRCCYSYDPLLGALASCGVLNSFTCQDRGDSKAFLNFNAVAASFSNFYRSSCGPSLRLTGSHPKVKGAVWYARQMNVGEGFDTSFTYRISNPSVSCINLNGIYDRCRSRGADGFAFVIQGSSPVAIGKGGQNIGYGGIHNSLAVEFDTYFNYEELEPYDNHVSIHSRGSDFPNSPNQIYSFAHTNRVPDLTEQDIHVRIKYVPVFDSSELGKESFVASPHLLTFWEKWKTCGMMYVYVNEFLVLVTPLNLAYTLQLNHDRAWVGFTSATGDDTWQAHDILQWEFTSLRMDVDAVPSID